MMLFSMSLAGQALDWAQHEPLSTIESWIDFREAFLKRFVRLPPFKSKYNHYSYHLERERDEEEWGGIPPHPEVLNEELIKHVFWSILEHMGREEHGGTWRMDAAQLDTQRKKGEAILKTSSTVYSTNRSSSSTRPAKLQLDRAGSQSQTRKMLLPP
ncbi:unnamed protein product [Microthlaspi erraticum]|uniref:Retrotransposon gag domain-containing protein n=1 Tax=Microthlaspi erraticum TaxID=1685480 RepID=A0A6D2KST0_9BRAS|nr:unnamed protein product [Microthlaspi erraticum]